MAIDRRNFLKNAGAMSLLPSIAKAQKVVNQPNILFIVCRGGWDPTMVFDAKVGIDTIGQESGASVVASTVAPNLAYVNHANRPAVQTFMNTFGANTAIINGVVVNSLNHDEAIKNLLGRYVPESKGRYADWMSFYAYNTALNLNTPHVVIDAPLMGGPYATNTVHLTTDLITELQSDIENATAIGDSAEAALSTYREASIARMLDGRIASTVDSEKLQRLNASYTRSSTLKSIVTSYVPGITISTPDASLSSRAVQNLPATFLRNGKLAIELFRNGQAKCVTLQCGSDDYWDSHTDNYTSQATAFENLFQGINGILDYAATTGVQSNLAIVVASEFGRNPTLNANSGKDHWPYTSVLLWGAGIAGGASYVGTGAYLRGVSLDPRFGGSSDDATIISMQNIMAALYVQYGISYYSLIPDTIIPLTMVLG